MGLGTVRRSNQTYLVVAGGFIWDRKKDETDANYAVQEFELANGEKGTRSGAQYSDLIGNVVNVQTKEHPQYGESINVTFESEGEEYILSVKTGTQNGQHLMKALLICDLSKSLYVNPYDFVEQGQRVRGISFKQGGKKLDLRSYELPQEFQVSKEFFKTSKKPKIKRFFEDLCEFLVGEVEEKIIPQFSGYSPKPKMEAPKVEAPKVEAPKVEAPKVETSSEVERPSPIKMKKAIKLYIEENYDGETMPKLSREDVVKWYDLVLAEEELPFESQELASDDELQSQLDQLL